jgi:hypothetical protein
MINEIVEPYKDTGIVIFPSEWQHKKEIVESRLNVKLHNSNSITRIFARNCDISKIPPEQSSEFQKKHHIQGTAGAKVHLGLFNVMELVEVMTFGVPRFSKKYEWELVRLVTKKNTIVVGGASKLFSYFIKKYNPKNIMSYSDNRWNLGGVYEKIGMKLDHESAPCYWYKEPNGQITHRSHYQRHKMEGIFNRKFDPKMTELEIMTEMGYSRFFDQGMKIFVWEQK